MKFVFFQGRQFPDANLPGVPSEETKAIFESAIRTLAQLHTLDTDPLHVDDIGDKGNFIKHRVRAFACVHYAHVGVYSIVSLNFITSNSFH